MDWKYLLNIFFLAILFFSTQSEFWLFVKTYPDFLKFLWLAVGFGAVQIVIMRCKKNAPKDIQNISQGLSQLNQIYIIVLIINSFAHIFEPQYWMLLIAYFIQIQLVINDLKTLYCLRVSK